MSTSIVDNVCLPVSSAYSVRPPFSVTAGVRGVLEAYGKLGALNPDAVIEALFASGEQGAWYDPSDLSTMFQDSTGTTFVTADGQPVGLILDKSKGLALGAERLVNGEFSGGSTGWTLATGWSYASGAVTHSGASPGFLGQSGPLTINKRVKIMYTITENIGARELVLLDTYWVDTVAIPTTVGTHTIYPQANSTDFWFYSTSTGTSLTIDNISVKELAGNHASQATAASRPLYKTTGLAEYNDYDAVDDVLNTTFPSSLGSSCTVAKAVVGGSPTILTGQTIGTSWAESTDNAGLIIINRALTGQETTDLTAWLTAKGATS